ncbi:MAG: SDR family oxidoreductase [Myxococcota bacterium]
MSQTPVAIVGVSALFPGSTDSHGFWTDILAGRDLVTEVPPSHWLIQDYYDPDPSAPDKTYSKRGAFLPDVAFDPMEFGVPPSIVPATDTSQLLALVVAQKVLEDACQGQFARIDRERASVILGVTSGQELLGSMVSRLQRPVWIKALRESGIPEDEAQAICDRMSKEYPAWQESTFPGLLGNVVAGRIANRFDLRGTNCVTDAACASTLSALSMGINELVVGQSDLVITGGVDTMNDIFMYMCFSKTPALSKTGDCRPFSDAADGTLLGEGLAMFALKRLSDAERDGDRIYAVVRGVGSASDGRSKSVYAPVSEGQARALRRAYTSAGYGPETVEMVEAHGTATKAGDVAEFEGLKLAFGGSGRADKQWCALGSVKSQIGHAKSAAGAAGLFKAIMALHHKVLPPTIKVERPNPALEVDKSPFYLNTETRPWIREASHPRRASVSSFGFGGSNFHVALEEYTGSGTRATRLRTCPTELVVLSAATSRELSARCEAIALRAKEVGLTAAARESQDTFNAAHHARAAVVAKDVTELGAKLEQVKSHLAAKPESALASPTGVHVGFGALQGDVAFVFPGQGSQYLGMGADVAMELDAARGAWDAAASLRFGGLALHEVVFPRPVFGLEEREAQGRRLTSTEWAQPALGVASLALYNVLRSVGVQPRYLGGHSFGEVTALCAAGALDPRDLVTVARARGEAMRDAASTPGAMTAVARPIEEVRALLAPWAGRVVVANHNHPTQVVLSGPTDDITQVEAELGAKGIPAKRLTVATAFHSPLVAPASARFSAVLAGIPLGTPAVETFSNAEAAPYPKDGEGIRARLAEQIAKPVRFVEEIEAMWTRGARTFVEVGPGAVLTDLVDRILGDRPHVAISLDRKGRHGVTSLQEGLGRLAVAGVVVDFAPLWAAYPKTETPPKRKPAMTIPINGANHGKPYPPPAGATALPPPNPPRAKDVPAHAVTDVPAPVAAAPTRPSPFEAAPSSDAHLAWVRAYQESQRQTADAHAAYLRTMADAHANFLKTAEASFNGLGAMLTGQPVLTVTTSLPTLTLPEVAQSAPVQAAPALPTVAPVAPVAVVAASPAPEPAPAPRPAAAGVDLQALMLAVVAEKTGYPPEMLGLQMELEADLGIDSIKRVEILSTMRERAPGLPEVNPAEMAALRTLGQIVEYMQSRGVVSAPAATPAPAATTSAPAAATTPPAPSADLEKLMLAVVAEKTGYPADMLGLQMELESDLGIDSIKRVEILSTMRERAPGLPEVNPAEMASLRTLGQIVEYMRSRGAGSTPAAAPAAPGAPAAPAAPARATAAAAPSADLEKLMLTVVAEKTGYPADMLGLQMELESDLGIDSIKRVEILSAMRERAPGLPEVNPAEMAQLRTLGQIVQYMRERMGGKTAAPTPAPTAQPAKVNTPLQRFKLVTEPAPACGLAMAGLLGARKIVVTEDGTGVSAALVRELSRRGLAAHVVEAVPEDAEAVIFLGGLRAVRTTDEAIPVNREAFRVARAIASRFAKQGGVFVTVQDTGGDFGLSGRHRSRAWLAGVSALARTAAIEWPTAAVKAIDVERGTRSADVLAGEICRELFTGGTTREVGLAADGSRWTLRSVVAEAAHAGVVVSGDDVVVASGGGRGVTAASLIALARKAHPRIVILGRSALEEEPVVCRGITDDAGLKRALLEDAKAKGRVVSPAEIGAQVARVLANREIRATLAAIESAGSKVRYLPVDVQDATLLRTGLDAVRREWGPVTTVVHGAGVLADKLIAEKTPEQFDRVFDTKVLGLRALLDATADDPLRWVVLFSSIAARTGNSGQCDYAMANEVLNKVAAATRRARGERCVVKSIGWGPWEGGMVTPALRAHFKQMGVALIPLDDGAQRFVQEIEAAPQEIETVIAGGVGEGPLGAVAQSAVSAEVSVDSQSHPYLADHRVGGKPVVPVALAMEWFARAAREWCPAGALRLRDVKVLRGIKLEHFANGGDRFAVQCKPLGNGNGLALELRGRDGALHYSATAEEISKQGEPTKTPDPALGAWTGDAVYDGHVLFHGPRFQVIRSIDGISAEGIAGKLHGTRDSGWTSEPWHVDPAALDGALQLAVLWARDLLGGAALPMAVAAFESYVDGLPTGTLRCVVGRKEVHAARAVCDVVLEDETGRLVAALRGVETILRPGEAARPATVTAGIQA